MVILFHPRVRKDIRDILTFYDEKSDSAGDRFLSEFDEALEKIKSMPSRFHPLDDKRSRCDLAKFPYHIVFEIEQEFILITVVRHHKRHPSFGLRRKWK
jgi:plasmid stabilization system protein ParE